MSRRAGFEQLGKTIGDAIRKARQGLKLTQAQAAERVGLTAEYYARIERGNQLPSIQAFVRLTQELHVSADALLGDPNDSSKLPALEDERPDVRRLLTYLLNKEAPLRLIALLIEVAEGGAFQDVDGRDAAVDSDDGDGDGGAA